MNCSIVYPIYYIAGTQSSGTVTSEGVVYHDTVASGCFTTLSGADLTFDLTNCYYVPPGDVSYCVDFYYTFSADVVVDFDVARVHYLKIDHSSTASGINLSSLGLYYYTVPVSMSTDIVNIPLNIGNNVLDIWNDGCYLLICTNSGVEYLNSRTFGSIWYFSSTVVRSVCSDQEKACFGTISSGIYYCNVPKTIGDLGDNFLASCKKITMLTSSGINDICTTSGGFFVGGNNGVDILTTSSGSDLEVSCQLTCSGVNSVAFSFDTETYYWSTASKAYCADTCE